MLFNKFKLKKVRLLMFKERLNTLDRRIAYTDQTERTLEAHTIFEFFETKPKPGFMSAMQRAVAQLNQRSKLGYNSSMVFQLAVPNDQSLEIDVPS